MCHQLIGTIQHSMFAIQPLTTHPSSNHRTVTVHPTTGREGPDGSVLVYIYPFISATDGVDGQRQVPGSFTRGKETRYPPPYKRLGGPQDRCRQMRKVSPPPVVDPRTVQPIVSRYTDWAIASHPVATLGMFVETGNVMFICLQNFVEKPTLSG